MKTLLRSFAVSALLPFAVAADEEPAAVRFDAGGDVRVRQEIMEHVPGLPGATYAVMPRDRKDIVNHFRFRTRVWFRADSENFGLYARVADEFREHVVKNGVRHHDRSYAFPDELILDSLYFEGRDLFDGRFDFRIGRQDVFDGRHSSLGLDRLMIDGTGYDGSRTCFFDMIRAGWDFTDASHLELFALYDSARDDVRWGNELSRARPQTALHPADEPEMDEWGGGAVWSSDLGDKRLPYRLYTVHKSAEAYTRGDMRFPAKRITTFGVQFNPRLTDEISLELEAAKQVGRRGDKQAGGWMGYAAAEWRKNAAGGSVPWARVSVYALSGDKHADGPGENDTGWDPMWARAPCDSEMFQYGTLYAIGYWSNIFYPRLTLGWDFAPRHGIVAYAGPMWAMADDGLGRADGGGSTYKGFLSSCRYDFPIRLAPKGAMGLDRFEIFGHVVAELLNPGDYYETSKPAWFVRWEFTVRF